MTSFVKKAQMYSIFVQTTIYDNMRLLLIFDDGVLT